MPFIKCEKCGAQIDIKHEKCLSCGTKLRNKTSVFTWILAACCGLILLEPFLIKYGTTITDMIFLSHKNQVIRNLDVDFEPSKGNFDNKTVIDLTITNNGSRDIKKFTVSCDYSLQNERNKRMIINDEIKAGETKHLTMLNKSMVDNHERPSSCKVTNLVLL